MAFTASAVWEIQTGGNDANGGGFDTGVSGFPTDGAATSANTSAPVFSSASYSFVAGDVGAYIFIKAGTNWTPGWYQIASVAGGAATLSAAAGSGVQWDTTLAAGGTPTTAAGCATVASPTGATWGIDYSQSASSRLSFTDLVIGATTTQFTSAGNPVGKNFVGNVLNVTSGTGFTVQRVAIVSTSGTTATCDKSLGTTASTGGVAALGGAFASAGAAGAVGIGGNTYWIKTGTYGIGSASTNVSGGCFAPTGGASNAFGWVEGYQAVRGDRGTPPTLKLNAGVSSATVINVSAATYCPRLINLVVDGNSQTSSRGVSGGTVYAFYLIVAKNCTNRGFNVAGVQGGATLVRCAATGCSSNPAFYIFGSPLLVGCEAYGNSATGFSGNGAMLVGCISSGNSGASSDGFYADGVRAIFVSCVAYGNGRDGLRSAAGCEGPWVNCLSVGNSGYGFGSDNTVGSNPILLKCAAYNNSSGHYSTSNWTPQILDGFVSLSGDPFTNAASGDFSLNNTAGAGASCRAAGFPGTLPRGTSVGYADIGAVPHADPASGGYSRGRIVNSVGSV